jgi:hypothetical protein
MKAVYNSGDDLLETLVCTSSVEALRQRLLDPDTLIALLLKSVYECHKFDAEKERWGSVTPNAYGEAMNKLMVSFEEKLWEVVESVDNEAKTLFPNSEKAEK